MTVSAAKVSMSSIVCGSNDDLRCSTSVRVKCSPDDTVGDLKKLIAAQTGTDPSKIQLKKWYATTVALEIEYHSDTLLLRYTIYKDHITLSDYEINDGMSLEMY